MRRLARAGAVTIAAIEGWRIGAGAGFDTPEVECGGNISGQSIPRRVSLVGAAKTRRVTLLVERVEATRALDRGIGCPPVPGQ